jgi:hypothetical protein
MAFAARTAGGQLLFGRVAERAGHAHLVRSKRIGEQGEKGIAKLESARLGLGMVLAGIAGGQQRLKRQIFRDG